MSADPAAAVTEILGRWRAGEDAAADDLMSALYPELRRLAMKYLRRERADHTLQPTALVHEVYLRLVGADVSYVDRVHFLAVAASTMRRLLVDHAKAHRALKRGGDRVRVTWTDGRLGVESDADVLDLDRALRQLAEMDQRKSRAIELHFFGGLSYDEIGELLGVSVATVNRELRFAKAWLRDAMRADLPEG